MTRTRRKTKLLSAPQIDTGGWQVVYTGFIMIMLCFFIMLTSLASLQQSRITRFAKSFSMAVSVLGGGRSLEKGNTIIAADSPAVGSEDKLAELFATVNTFAQQNGLEQQVALRSDERGVIMTLSETLLFESGHAELDPRAVPLLHQIAGLIRKTGVPVDIQGHTDNVPIQTNLYPSNWELSTARAINVLRFLLEREGLDGTRLSAVGRAWFQPVEDNGSAAGRARNRRVEFIFKVDEKL